MSSVVPSEKKLTEEQLGNLADEYKVELNVLKAFCEVEGSGIGFSDYTGKILIQFEPSWYKRENKDWEKEKGIWQNNGVSNQTKEWAAFSDAYNKDPFAALMATSIGELQVLGLNHFRCDFNTASSMWQYNEINERNQVETGLRFIKSDGVLYKAVQKKQWVTIEERYNGKGSRALAEKLKVLPYWERMSNAYNKFNRADYNHRTTTTVNLRSGGGTQYPVVAVLRVNTTIGIEGQHNGWSSIKVAATGQQGWVNSAYIK